MPPAWLVTLSTTARLVFHAVSVFGQPVFIAAVIAFEVSCSQSVALLTDVPPPLVCRQYRTHVFAGSDVWKMKSYGAARLIVLIALTVGLARLRSCRDARSIASRAACALSCWSSTARLDR